MRAYEKLLEPITIGTHTWRNRMVKAPSSAMSWDPGQFCNDRIIGLYDAISKGGASAIILGGMICDDPATLIDDADGGVYTVETYPLGGLYDDKFIPGLTQLANVVHDNGCELIAQIFQNGAAIKTKGGAWCSSTLSAEELPSPEPYCHPTRGLSLEEIAAFKERYFAAAERAKRAGLDGVEVHAANGYFLLSFVSRVWNHRNDQYGCQSIENRTRLVCEIIRGVKERCGEDFIVGVRTNGQEWGHPDAITVDEGVEIAKFYDAAAPVIYKDSIDMEIAFQAARYGKGSDDYINCPMDREQYMEFYEALISAETAPVHGFEESMLYEGCMPIESMAKRGQDTIRYGPLKPVGLRNPRTGLPNYAVVQLRRDNLEDTLYNMVGFQTRLKFGEQKNMLLFLKNS